MTVPTRHRAAGARVLGDDGRAVGVRSRRAGSPGAAGRCSPARRRRSCRRSPGRRTPARGRRRPRRRARPSRRRPQPKCAAAAPLTSAASVTRPGDDDVGARAQACGDAGAARGRRWRSGRRRPRSARASRSSPSTCATAAGTPTCSLNSRTASASPAGIQPARVGDDPHAALLGEAERGPPAAAGRSWRSRGAGSFSRSRPRISMVSSAR